MTWTGIWQGLDELVRQPFFGLGIHWRPRRAASCHGLRLSIKIAFTQAVEEVRSRR